MIHPRTGRPATSELDPALFKSLRDSIRGQMIGPQDSAYNEARMVFNHMIDRYPAAIVRCADADDVSRSIDFAYLNELPLAVRGGGHSVAGHSTCDGGLVIDLSPMKRIIVDSEARTATAGAGLTLGELDAATQEYGLATPLGIISVTGIAGLTLGGGIGWINGKHGLACDNVLSVEIVTADGRKLRASRDDLEDLYWAVRGGSGNFGVVTSFEYRLHPVGPVLGGAVVYPIDSARDVLRNYREVVATGPDELSTVALLGSGPDGSPVLVIALCYSGRAEDGERIVKPLKELGPVLADQSGTMEYTLQQSMFDAGFPHGNLHYWKSNFISQISDDAINLLIESTMSRPTSLTGIGLQHMHGAAARVNPTETAFPHRADHFDCIVLSQWGNPADTDANVRWTREFGEAIQPHVDRGVYVNDLGDEGQDRVLAAYGANYHRLAEIKARYDPENLFRLNQNIPPAIKV